MKRIAYTFPAILILGATSGCGSVITDTSSGSAASSASGAGGSSSNSSATAAVGSSSVTTGSGAGGSCSEPSETVTIALQGADGVNHGCGFGLQNGAGDVVLQGQVAQVAPGVVVVDTCPPNANCAPTLATLSVKAPGYELSLPMGAFVELRMHVEQPMGCGSRLLITSLPEWAGMPNPAGPLDPVLLAASEGLEGTFPEAPFGIDKVSVCKMGIAGGAEAFSLRFFAAGDPPGSGVTVTQGASVVWSASFQKHGPLMLRNLRSFESGFDDDYWNWSYLVVPALVGK